MPKFRKIYSQNFLQSRKKLIFELKPPLLGALGPPKRGLMIFHDPNICVIQSNTIWTNFMPKFRKIYSQNFSQSRKNLILGLKPPFWGLIRGFTAPKKARQGKATGIYPLRGVTDQRLSGGGGKITVLMHPRGFWG